MSGLSRVPGKKSADTKEGTFPSRRILQENKTCDSGDLTRVKIDSCRIINNSYLLLVSLSDKSVLKTAATEKKHFNEAEMCGKYRGCRGGDQVPEVLLGSRTRLPTPPFPFSSQFTGAKLHLVFFIVSPPFILKGYYPSVLHWSRTSPVKGVRGAPGAPEAGRWDAKVTLALLDLLRTSLWGRRGPGGDPEPPGDGEPGAQEPRSSTVPSPLREFHSVS